MAVQLNNLWAGDILLYNADNLIARLIRKFDNAEVSHAGMYLGDGLVGEALIVGNSGLNRNPISVSVASCNWVEAARLKSPVAAQPVLARASVYLDQGNRYAYEQVFMLAMILLTRKLDQGNWLVRQIAERTLRGCASLLQQWRNEEREPMICSEFVFRAYDEALPDDIDEFTIEINAHGTRQSRRMISPRRRHRIFGATAASESPTVHPASLLTKLVEQPARITAAPIMTESLKSADEIEAEIELAAREYLGDATPMRSSSGVGIETTVEDVESAAAVFAQALIGNDGLFAKSPSLVNSSAMKAADADNVGQLKQVVADFVTPGDLHRSSNLSLIGRLALDGADS